MFKCELIDYFDFENDNFEPIYCSINSKKCGEGLNFKCRFDKDNKSINGE